MNYETILVETEDGVTLITLNRPERLNAWTHQMNAELQAAFQAGNNDPAVEAFVFTGAGRGFCAGADIKDIFQAQAQSGESRGGSNEASSWVGLIRASKPVVAAINGAAIGVGLTQVLPMDYLIASDQAKLSCRFIKMGLVPELASSQFLIARCGFGGGSELMLSGKTISAEEALRVRLVDRVVSHESLLAEAKAVAKSMGENPQSALAMVKQLITENMAEPSLDAVQQREMEALLDCYETPEHIEAIAAFVEKRNPDFKSARDQH